MTIDKNDPRLIDYALGELDEKERAAFEKELAKDSDARETIAQYEVAAHVAANAMDTESELALTPEQRAVIGTSAKSGKSWRFTRNDFVGAVAAAAILVVFAAMLVPGLTRSREAARRATPENEARQAALEAQIAAAERASSSANGIEIDDRTSSYSGGVPIRPLDVNTSNSAPVESQIASFGYPVEVRLDRALPAPDDGAVEQRTPMAVRPDGLHPGLQNVRVGGDLKIRGSFYAPEKTQPGFGGGAGGSGGGGGFTFNGVWPFQTAAAPEQNVWRFNDIPNVREQSAPSNTEAYDRVVDNPFLTVLDNPLSTFSIDVDTASYANIRRFLNQGQLPPKDAVRIEEMINYFDYAYEPPTGEHPFAVHVEVAACPWQPGHQLARIGLQGKVLDDGERPPANLVFLIDVSGSMNQPNKLPLVVESMKLLVDQMRPDDTIALTVYAGSSGLVLPPTTGQFKDAIRNALNNLRAGGSTNGGEGIQLAYRTAKQAFKDGGVNRVILATDGDFNVGVTGRGALTRMVEQHAEDGVFLSLLGFGMGNLKDATMEELSNKGNGNYAYIDTLNEARKVLVEQAAGTLVTIAKDVKIQVDFNPAQVQAYRLIGYENRVLAAEDFEDDTKDAGEIGAGHRVTALYELVPAGAPFTEAKNVTDSVYRQPAALSNTAQSGELMQVRLRYKKPEGDTSIPLVVPVPSSDRTFDTASPDFQFASAVAAFGMLLRDSPHKGSANHNAVLTTAQRTLGADPHGYRNEFVQLVQTANALRSHETQAAEQQLRNAERAYQEALENMQRIQQQQ